MKSKWMKPIGAATLAAGLTLAYAQTPSTPAPAAPHSGHRSANGQGRMQRGFERMATNLNLTEAQKTEAKAILKQSHEAARQFAPQLKQNREALAAAVKANNAAEIERLSAERGNLMGKMTALHSEAFAKIYQGLTPEQRTKADQMKEHFRGMHQRRQGRSQADKS